MIIRSNDEKWPTILNLGEAERPQAVWACITRENGPRSPGAATLYVEGTFTVHRNGSVNKIRDIEHPTTRTNR